VDTNFQTSFIPKKPLAEDRSTSPRSVSLLGLIATVIFITALVSAGGVYLYKGRVAKNIITMQGELESARNAFEPSLITQLGSLDRRIASANELLKNHIVVSPIFEALQLNTLKSIQFTKFSYTTPMDASSQIPVHMAGRARDYASIALQSDQMGANKNIHNAIFSNLALDERTGFVTFDLAFTVDPDLVRYMTHLSDITPQTGTAVPAATPTAPAVTTPTTQPTGLPVIQ
jgi:hypothetical protein